MSPRLLALSCSLCFACTPLVPPIAPEEPAPAEGAMPRQLFGTGRADLWRFWVDAPVNNDRTTPRVPHLRHINASGPVTVPVPSLFDEASCGVPAALAAVTPGKLWLASFFVPGCGFGGGQSNHRIVLGTLARDGTWVDRSADLPTVQLPATYQSVEFISGAGLLLLKVRGRNAQGSEGFRFFRVTDTATTELVLDSGTADGVVIVDATHVYAMGGNGGSFTHQLQGDSFVTLAAPIEYPGGLLTRGGPEVWLWNANEVSQQAQNRVAWRFDGSAFQRVDFTLTGEEPPGYGWQAVGAVPRGGGKLTLLGLHLGQGIYAYSEHEFTARQLTGTTLSGDTRVYGLKICDGGNQTTQECMLAGAHHEQTLDDGTIVLRTPSIATGSWAALVPPEVIP